MESFKSDTATKTDRRNCGWLTLREHFLSPQDHSLPPLLIQLSRKSLLSVDADLKY